MSYNVVDCGAKWEKVVIEHLFYHSQWGTSTHNLQGYARIMFSGEFEHSIDSKGRLTIPARFRDDLEGGVVVTRGLDGCLWAYPRSEWEILAEKLAKLPTANKAARNFSRFMFSSAFDSIPDRQGRVLIPQKLREYAGIDNETAVIGVMNRVEIWNPAKWSETFSEVEADPEAIAAQLDELDIDF